MATFLYFHVHQRHHSVAAGAQRADLFGGAYQAVPGAAASSFV